MKLRLFLGALIAMGIVASAAYAGSPRVGELTSAAAGGTFETTIVDTFTSSTALVSNLGPNNILYGFDVQVTGSTGWCALYDEDAVADIATTQGVFIGEGGHATAGNTVQSLWPAPYKLQRGLVVACVSAKATIYHDVK